MEYVNYLPIVEVAFGSVPASFTTELLTVGTGNQKAARQCIMRNDTDAALYISLDGANSNLYLAAGDLLVLDFQKISSCKIKYASAAPTAGSFRVSFGLP